MLPYPPPYAQSKTEENSVLRALGAILALLGMLLAVLGIIFHQNVAELVFALLIAILSLRIFVLWLGDTQHNRNREPFTPPRSALHNSPSMTLPYLSQRQSGYLVPQQPQSSFFQGGTNQATVPFAPAPVAPAVPFAPASTQDLPSTPRPLPPSVRPQAQRAFFPNQAQAIPPDSFAPPTQSFPPSPFPPGQSMPPAPLSQSMQAPTTWSYTPPPYVPGQSMPPTQPGQPGQPVDSRQLVQQPGQEGIWQG
jgi:hypothetical protein